MSSINGSSKALKMYTSTNVIDDYQAERMRAIKRLEQVKAKEARLLRDNKLKTYINGNTIVVGRGDYYDSLVERFQ